jgi:hypothetical protein
MEREMSMLEVLSEELLHKEFGEHVRAEQTAKRLPKPDFISR